MFFVLAVCLCCFADFWYCFLEVFLGLPPPPLLLGCRLHSFSSIFSFLFLNGSVELIVLWGFVEYFYFSVFFLKPCRAPFWRVLLRCLFALYAMVSDSQSQRGLLDFCVLCVPSILWIFQSDIPVVLVHFNCGHCIVGIVYLILLWGVIPRTYRRRSVCKLGMYSLCVDGGMTDAPFVRWNDTGEIAINEVYTRNFCGGITTVDIITRTCRGGITYAELQWLKVQTRNRCGGNTTAEWRTQNWCGGIKQAETHVWNYCGGFKTAEI